MNFKYAKNWKHSHNFCLGCLALNPTCCYKLGASGQ